MDNIVNMLSAESSNQVVNLSALTLGKLLFMSSGSVEET